MLTSAKPNVADVTSEKKISQWISLIMFSVQEPFLIRINH